MGEAERLLGIIEGKMTGVEKFMSKQDERWESVDNRLIEGDKTMTRIDTTLSHVQSDVDCISRAIKDPNSDCPQGKLYQSRTLEKVGGLVDKKITDHVNLEHDPNVETAKWLRKIGDVISGHKKETVWGIIGLALLILGVLNQMGVT